MINITSENHTLRKVMLHRPGKELLAIKNDNLSQSLIDEVIDLQEAINEHQVFSNILKDNGVEVVYVEDLLTDVFNDNELLKKEFLKELLLDKYNDCIYEDILKYDNHEFVLKCIEGITYNNELISIPMSNLYFQRDPMMVIGNMISINNMSYEVRHNETLLIKYICKYHKDFINTYFYINETDIEGGDIINLDENNLLIGISQRTRLHTIEALAKQVFEHTSIKNVYAIDIPDRRSCMHLDTVLGRISKDSFALYPNDLNNVEIIKYTKDNKETLQTSIESLLQDILQTKLNFVYCYDEFEQWNDGVNTLAINEDTIIVYKVNAKMNEKIKALGINVIEFDGTQLGKGRGGPHCMSQPLIRDYNNTQILHL